MKPKIKRILFDYLGISLGSVLTAIGLDIFLIPNKIAAGGVSGIATLVYYLFELPPGIIMFAINIPLFIVGIKVLGKQVGLRTLFGIVILSFSVDFLNTYLPVLTQDPLLAALYGGGLTGLGLGIVFKSRGTTGGTDLIAALIHHFSPGISVGKGLLAIDALVVTAAGLVFNAELALYAVISLFVASKVIDLVQEGFNLAKAALVISNQPQEIQKEILENMGRGVTTLKGRGGYTGENKEVLLVIVTRAEVTHLKRLVHRLDPRAFVIITEVHEVVGEGFKTPLVD